VNQLQYEFPSRRVRSRRTGKWVYLRWKCKVCKSSKLDLVYFDVGEVESLLGSLGVERWERDVARFGMFRMIENEPGSNW